jgi:hypothetical protein
MQTGAGASAEAPVSIITSSASGGEMRMATPEKLLQRVTDRDSFIAFVEALAEERAEAAEMERASPQSYIVDGALGWKNGDIDGFLSAALDYFEPGPYHKPASRPSWRMFAEFLWCGKIIE